MSSLGDPPSNLLILTAGEPERPLRCFHPVFRKQCPTHDSGNGVGVGAQEHMPQFMGHDMAQPRRVKPSHEYDGAGVEADPTANRPDAVPGGLRLGLELDDQSAGSSGAKTSWRSAA